MACMGCSVVKKGLAVAALSAGALYLAFGTSAPSYVRTAFHKVRGHAHNAVPVQFEIDRAREEVRRLDAPIKDTIETYCRTEVEAKWLKDEIATVKTNLERERTGLQAMKDRVKTGDLKLTGSVNYSAAELTTELTRKFDNYKYVSKILQDKEATLKSKQKIMDAARQQLANLNAQKRELMTKLESIEARLQQIEAAKQKNDFTFDDSALSQAKKNVSDLEKRVEVQARISEVEGNLSDTLPIYVEPGRDVVREIEEELGSSSDGAKADKSL
jgi:DNA repair exonuclease SbcCD ATPase subunit